MSPTPSIRTLAIAVFSLLAWTLLLPAPAARAEEGKGATTFATLCVSCHGEKGKGDGVAAAALDPKPTNFTNAEFQKGRTDEQIKKVILEGGAANGKSPIMAPFAAAVDGATADALVKYIRTLGSGS